MRTSKLVRALFLGALVLFSAVTLSAQSFFTVQQVPNPKQTGSGYVSDPEGYLSSVEVAEINRLLTDLEASSTAQGAVVMLNSIGDANPKEFATALFNTWKIGQAGKDNGLLILVVMDQRRTEFETGDGLEGLLPDLICYRVGMEVLSPNFQKSRFGQGLILTVQRFSEILTTPDALQEMEDSQYNPVASGGRNNPWIGLVYYGFVNLVFHIFLLGYLFYHLGSRDEAYDKYRAVRRVALWPFLVVFPLPYVLVYLFLRKRLKALRYQPRFSRISGAPLRLVPEEEEDYFLEKGQVTEEEIGVADYDVWVSETDENDLLILRYGKWNSTYSRCPSCHYVTYYHSFSQTLTPATYSHSGRRLVVYACKNCNYQERKEQTIPKKVQSTSSSGGFSGSSGGSRSGGSSSWGGGRSSGGGAGVSW
ncbi:MAG: TPM domain-containing protein [Lewinellaceae bacterium]|nr:TPM domain-containing protein [Lewinellaceae bacterium]